jgi:hypothetical protein
MPGIARLRRLRASCDAQVMVTRPVMSYTLAPRSGAGTFVVGVVQVGEIANMDRRALSSGR